MNIEQIKTNLAKIAYTPQQMEGISDSAGGLHDHELSKVAHQVFDEMMRAAFVGEKKLFIGKSSIESALRRDKKWDVVLKAKDMKNLHEIFSSFGFEVDCYPSALSISWENTQKNSQKKKWWKL